MWYSKKIFVENYRKKKLLVAVDFSPLPRIIGWGFCDIQNNQGQGGGYQPKPKAEAEADNPYQENGHDSEWNW